MIGKTSTKYTCAISIFEVYTCAIVEIHLSYFKNGGNVHVLHNEQLSIMVDTLMPIA